MKLIYEVTGGPKNLDNSIYLVNAGVLPETNQTVEIGMTSSKCVLQQRHLLCYESEPWTLALNPNPNPRTHPNPKRIFKRNRNKVFERKVKQNRTKMTPEYRST